MSAAVWSVAGAAGCGGTSGGNWRFKDGSLTTGDGSRRAPVPGPRSWPPLPAGWIYLSEAALIRRNFGGLPDKRAQAVLLMAAKSELNRLVNRKAPKLR